MLLAAVHASEGLDRFSVWLLVFTGAAFSLLLSHASPSLTIIHSPWLERALVALFLSGCSGFIAHGIRALIEIQLAIEQAVVESWDNITERLPNQDIGPAMLTAMKQFASNLSTVNRWLTRNVGARAIDDRLFASKRLFRYSAWHRSF